MSCAGKAGGKEQIMWYRRWVRVGIVMAIAVTSLVMLEVIRLGMDDGRAAVAAPAPQPSGRTDVALSAAPLAASPNACGVIAYEEGVAGAIRATGDRCRHVFTGSSGDIVSIWLESTGASSLAPVLQLVDPTGNIVQEEVRRSAGQSAAIRYVRLSQSGVYSIVVAGYRDRSEGAYALSLWRTNACGGSLDELEPRYGELTSRQTECAYTFRARQDGYFPFQVSAPDGNQVPRLEVQDSNGRTIQESSADGRLVFQVPRAGVYTVIVSTGGSSQRTGRFVLSMELITIELAPGCGKTLEYGDVLVGEIGSSLAFDACYYAFRAEAGDVVTIVMIRRSSSLDPYLELENSDGDRIAWDNNSAGNKNAEIRARRLSADGLHSIVARAYDDQTTGPFELRLGLGQFVLGDEVRNVHPGRDTVNIRRSAGWRNKPSSDVVGEIRPADTVEIVGGPEVKDNLTWWMISYTTPTGDENTGWSADTGGSGTPLLALAQ